MNIRIGDREYSVWRIILALVGVALGLGYAEWSHRKPKIGRACDNGALACRDTLTMLSCEDGTYTPSPCRGPKGCVETSTSVSCDLSGNLNGDSCATAFEAQGRCASDGSTEVSCEHRKMTVDHCRGPNGCKEDGNRYTCDHAKAATGDRCEGSGAACTVDGTEMLACSDAGVYTPDQPCRGAAGCHVEGATVKCDTTIAAEGDACEEGAACTVAGDALLHCSPDTHRLFLAANCRASGGARGCVVAAGNVTCAHDVAIEGDVCSSAGGLCSEDGKAALTCKDGHYVVRQRCRDRCSDVGDRIACR